MAYAILDVREWDTVVRMDTGEPLPMNSPKVNTPMLDMARQVIKGHPYPGDFSSKSIEWVTDTALRLWKTYDPHFMFMIYAQPGILGGVKYMTPDRWNSLVCRVFQNVNRFIEITGYIPIIVGLGDMVPLKEYIDLSGLDGIGYIRMPNRRYAGFYNPTDRDISRFDRMPGIERTVSKCDFINLFEPSDVFRERLPDYLIVAKEGYSFKTLGTSSRTGYKTIAKNEAIPVYTGLPNTEINSLVDLKDTVIKNINHQRIALILLDGIGTKDFPGEYRLCNNSLYWYTYCQGDDSYFAVSCGEHFQHSDYPPGWLDFTEDFEMKTYPYDGFIEKPLSGSIGNYLRTKMGITSAAAGSRSTFTHLSGGADICIECCCCGLYNYGTKAVIYKTQAS
ncbi:MAG: hypothetical protein GX969_07030 [Firmicutes bacterium]|nr:hypothetical protein [Bacillota bacterium]